MTRSIRLIRTWLMIILSTTNTTILSSREKQLEMQSSGRPPQKPVNLCKGGRKRVLIVFFFSYAQRCFGTWTVSFNFDT